MKSKIPSSVCLLGSDYKSKKNSFKIMSKRLKLLLFIPCIILQYGCTNDSTSDLLNPVIDNQITYTATVKSIIDNNCIVCHTQPPQNGAPMTLTTYADVKNAVLTRGLLNRISRAQGEAGMMPNGGIRLPQATIDKVTAWANSGFPE